MARKLSVLELSERISTLVRQIDAKIKEDIDPDTKAADLAQLRNTLHRYQKLRRQRTRERMYYAG